MQSCLLISEKGTEVSTIWGHPLNHHGLFLFFTSSCSGPFKCCTQHGCSGFKEAILSSSEGRLPLILYASFPIQFIVLFLLSSLSRDEKPMSDRWMPFFPLIFFESSLSWEVNYDTCFALLVLSYWDLM